ncbi:MAG: SBBP repeat-containing protein [Pseudomonadota bacterium]
MKGITRLAAIVFAALFFIIGVAIPAPSIAAEGDLIWATQAGGNAYDSGVGIAVDPEGNRLVTGYFYYSAVFGKDEPNETLLTSGYQQMFVAKYDSEGALLWATQAVGPGGRGENITVDSTGNSLVTGVFYGTTTFGADELNQTQLTSTGGWDIFIAKYYSDGSLLWAKQAGGIERDTGYSISMDSVGNTLVTGSFNGTATFGAGEHNETLLTSDTYEQIFVAKYDSEGALLWATQAVGPGGLGKSITVDSTSNSLVTGVFYGTTTFGTGELNQTQLTSTGGWDIFVAKYYSDGSLLWAKQAGGSESEIGYSISVSPEGNGLITGSFRGSATFGGGGSNEIVLTANGEIYPDIFIAKYAPSGELLWATQAGGEWWDEGLGIALDPAGNSLVAGYFSGIAVFGAGETNESLLTAGEGINLFVAKYAPDGNLKWVTQAGGESHSCVEGPSNVAFDIEVDAVGDSVITGYFCIEATFGAGEPNETLLTAVGNIDIFVAQYADEGHVIEQPDLNLAMEADPSPARVGRPWIYRLSVWNQGPGDATEVVLTDNLPDKIRLLSIPEPCDLSEENVVRCPLGTLSAGEGYQLEIEVRPKGPGVRFNAACVESLEPDLNEVDNCVELETLVVIPLDILE